jgi:serine/threonine-protein kinase
MGAYGFVPVGEGFDKARAAIERALALVPDLPEALIVRAQIEGTWDRAPKRAEETMRRALAGAPGSAAVLDAMAQLATRLGKFAEAEAAALRSIEIDPLSPRAWITLSGVCRVQGRHADAEASMRKALALSPQRVISHHMLGWALALQGKLDEALGAAKLEPSRWARLTGFAAIHYLAGHRAESDAALAELIRDHSGDCAFQIAAIHALRDERDEAFRWLDRALETHDAGAMLAPTEPSFRGIQDDPRWPVFVRRLGLDPDEIHAAVRNLDPPKPVA